MCIKESGKDYHHPNTLSPLREGDRPDLQGLIISFLYPCRYGRILKDFFSFRISFNKYISSNSIDMNLFSVSLVFISLVIALKEIVFDCPLLMLSKEIQSQGRTMNSIRERNSDFN